MFLIKIIHAYGRVVYVTFKKCLLQFPVSAVDEFFSGDIFEFCFVSPFPCRRLLVSKTYICLNKNKTVPPPIQKMRDSFRHGR